MLPLRNIAQYIELQGLIPKKNPSKSKQNYCKVVFVKKKNRKNYTPFINVIFKRQQGTMRHDGGSIPSTNESDAGRTKTIQTRSQICENPRVS